MYFFEKTFDIFCILWYTIITHCLVEILPAPLGAVSTTTVAKPGNNAIGDNALHRYKIKCSRFVDEYAFFTQMPNCIHSCIYCIYLGGGVRNKLLGRDERNQ